MSRQDAVFSERPARAGRSVRLRLRAPAATALVLLVCLSPCLLVSSSSLCLGEETESRALFHRVLLPPERVAEELARVPDGVLVRLPLAEFDVLAAKAAQAGKRPIPPRLLEARYHALLKDESLIGEGQWKLIQQGSSPGLLNLEPFNLALRQARFENGDAIIAAFDGKAPALLVETAGEHTVSLDWSARGEAGPEGVQFHLEAPPCPVGLLELDVPAGRAVTVLNDGAFLTGPHEAETSDLRRWKITCGGRRPFDFRILPPDRPAAGAAQTLPPLVRQKTTQKLYPDGLEAVFELTLEGHSQGVREFVCECDAELRLRDVAGPNVEGCTFQAGKKGAPSRLTIRLGEPARGGTWQISCLAPLHALGSPADQRIAWKSPGLRLVNGVPRGETLELWLHPEVRVESWDPGSFRLRSSDVDRMTGMQVLTLGGGGLGPPRRPQARLQVHGVEFRAPQTAWWRCDAAGMALTLQIAWDVTQGQLFQLPVQLPSGWSVEKVEMTPAALMRDWRPRTADGKTTLFVDLAKPLAPRPASETPRTRLPYLTVLLRPAWSGAVTGKPLPFPEAIVPGARFHEGALALDCDEQLFHLTVNTAAQRSQAEGEGPWGPQLPDYYYRFSNKPLQGTLRVDARPPRLRARCNSDVFIVSGLAIVETHVQLEAEVGNPGAIDLLLSAGDAKRWQWRNESSPRDEDASVLHVRQAEHLTGGKRSAAVHVLAAQNPLQACALAAAQPSGERWRLTLTRPLRARETLRLRSRRELQPRGNRWDVPLPVVLGADRMEGEVRLYLSAGDLLHVDTRGLREAASAADKGMTPWRTYRYGQSEVALTLSGQALASDRATVAVIDRARLLTSVRADGTLRHHFSFQVANWTKQTLPLILPPGARPLTVAVDGRWLPRVVPAAGDGPADGDAIELALPVPARTGTAAGDNVHDFEVVYVRDASVSLLWQSLEAPAPRLPIAPLAFRRVWRLPANWTPLHASRYQSLAASAGPSRRPALPRRAADLFRLPGSWARLDPLLEDRQAGAREALEHALAKLRLHRGKPRRTLGDVVREIAFFDLKDRYHLIIDAQALLEADVGPKTALTVKGPSSSAETPPWAECGLVAVPGRSAILLTTRAGCGTALREPLDETIERRLAAAASRGQDASGRFRSALNWLYPDHVSVAQADAARPLEVEEPDAEGREWEALAGESPETLVAVRREGVMAAGLVGTLLLGLVFWLLRRSSARRRVTLLLLVLGVLGTSTLWLPVTLRDLAWWPLLAGCGAAVVWYVRASLRSPRQPRSSSKKGKRSTAAAAVAGLVIVILFGWNSRAAAPAPATVYVVPGPAGTADRQTVLVPADLLDRLKTLARPAPLVPGRPSAVLLDAAYEGQMVEGQAEFTAVFSAHCLSDEPANLTVGLAGVQLLGDVLLDGARIAPRTLPAPQTGYSLKIKGRGRHKIELRFRTPVVGTREDRNVLFTVPPLVRSRLSWRVPPRAVDSRILIKYGAQWSRRDGGERLEADLGALPRPVHLHWYQPNGPTSVFYQAAYLWDLGLSANQLTAWLRYHVRTGAVNSLEVELPAELEVVAAAAQRTLSAASPPWLTRSVQLHDWYVRNADGKRLLHLTLPYAISGDLEVTLQLLPRRPLQSPVRLPLPSPRGAAADGPHYLAYRTHPGLNARFKGSLYVSRIGAKDFAPNWASVPRLESPFAGAAYRINAGQSPHQAELRLDLDHRPPLFDAEIDLTVQASATRARMELIADLTAPNKDLAAVTWELRSPCTITAVSGDDVRSWKQSNGHLLVWLKHTKPTTRIQLSGWLSLVGPPKSPHLHLVGPHLTQAHKQHVRLHLLPVGDVSLAALRTNNLRPVAPTEKKSGEPSKITGAAWLAVPTEELERTFEATQPFYELHCEVQSAANASANVLTVAEVADRELRFTTTVKYQIHHGELRHVQFRLRDWEREKVEVQAEHVALWSGPRRAAGERAWHLPLQPGITGHYQVTLRYGMPLDDVAVGLPMPQVHVQGVDHADYRVAVVGGEVTGQPRGTLEPVRQGSKSFALAWPGAAARLERSGGQVWHVRGAEWQLRLWPHARTLEEAAVRVYLLEQSAVVMDGRRWLHEARCWLRHEARGDLHVDFPAPVRVLAAAIDGVEVTPLQPSPSRLWLALPGRTGVRCIRLRWLYDSPEPLDRPNLTSPQVVDALQGPRLWTVLVPAGWEASRGSPDARLGWGATRTAARALHRADAQLRISQDLCKEHPDSAVSAALTRAQKRLAFCCREARCALDVGANHGGVTGPEGQSLAEWLDKLQADNRRLLVQNGRETLLEQMRNTEGEPPSDGSNGSSFCLPSGTPLSWQARADGAPPTLQLTAQAGQQTRQALAASGQWLGGLVVVWILSFLPFLLARLRLFWPEQLAVVGLFGWYLAGLTSIVLALLVIAACGRGYLLARGLRSFFRRQRRSGSTMTAGSNAVA